MIHADGAARREAHSWLAPLLAGPGVQVVALAGGLGAARYVPRRRWALTIGDVHAPAGLAERARSEHLDRLAERRLCPALFGLTDPLPYRRRGFALAPFADEAVIDLPTYTVNAATADLGLLVLRCADEHAVDLGVPVTDNGGDLWVALDRDGTVQAYCTWRPYARQHARVLDQLQHRPGTPAAALDALLAATLCAYRDAGLAEASLLTVPRTGLLGLRHRLGRDRGARAAARRLAPRWRTLWLAVPAGWQRPLALAALGELDRIRRAAR